MINNPAIRNRFEDEQNIEEIKLTSEELMYLAFAESNDADPKDL